MFVNEKWFSINYFLVKKFGLVLEKYFIFILNKKYFLKNIKN
jgi:hypothetical protein